MTILTKSANDVFSPVDGAGNGRAVSNQDAQVWGTEIETAITAAATGLVRATSAAGLGTGTRVGQPGEVMQGPDKGEYAWNGSSWVRVGDLIDATALEAADEAEVIARIQAIDALQLAKADVAMVDDLISPNGLNNSDDGITVEDDFGWVILRISKEGRIRTASVDLGSGSELAVQDRRGFVGLRLDSVGQLHLSDMILGVDKSGLVVVDPIGFVGLRLDRGGLRVNGHTIGPPSITSLVADVPSLHYLTRGIFLPPLPNLPKWRYGLAGVLQSFRPTTMAFVGDSNTRGSQSDGNGIARRIHSHPSVVARLLNRLYPTKDASFWGSSGETDPSTYAIYDSRLSAGAGWGFSEPSVGGEMWSNSTTTTALSFDPGIVWDTAELWVASTDAAELTLDIGDTATTFNPTIGHIGKITYSTVRGANTLNIKRAAGQLNIVGCLLRDSIQPEINVLNMGRGGWRAGHWVADDSFYSPRNALIAIAADLYIIELGLNEFIGSESIASFTNNMQSLIDACASTGAAVVMVTSVTATSSRPIPWSDYVVAISTLAQANNLPLIDMTARFGVPADLAALPWKTDTEHPNFYGYADKAKVVANFLEQI
jgi:hypothetical protein